MGWVGQRALQDLRERIYTHLQGMSIGFFTRNRPGVLISRLTNDVEALDSLVTDGVVTLISSTLTLLGVVVILLLLDLPLALVTFLTFPLLAVGSVVFRIASAGAYRLTREKIANITAYLQETLSGVRVVRSFAQEPRHLERMAELNEENRVANMRTVYLNAAYFPAVELLSAIGTAVILLYGGYQAIDGNIEIGVLVAFVGYLNAFFDPIQQISQLYTTYQQGMAALDKIFDLLDTRPDMVDQPGCARPGAAAGRDRAGRRLVLLRRRDARAAATGLAGSTCAFRRDRPWRWSARRGRESRRWRSWWRASTTRSAAGCWSTATTCGICSARALRSQLGIVPQEGFLFSGTIRENIAFGRPDACEEEIRAAAAAVGADTFIERLRGRVRDRGRRARASTCRPASGSWSPSRGRCWPSRAS